MLIKARKNLKLRFVLLKLMNNFEFLTIITQSIYICTSLNDNSHFGTHDFVTKPNYKGLY